MSANEFFRTVVTIGIIIGGIRILKRAVKK